MGPRGSGDRSRRDGAAVAARRPVEGPRRLPRPIGRSDRRRPRVRGPGPARDGGRGAVPGRPHGDRDPDRRWPRPRRHHRQRRDPGRHRHRRGGHLGPAHRRDGRDDGAASAARPPAHMDDAAPRGPGVRDPGRP